MAPPVELLVGKTVELVCFAQYTVYIHFEGDTLLTVEGGFRHIRGGSQIDYLAESPIRESSLMSIVESSIASGNVAENGELHFVFSNSDELTVFKRLEFESHRLKVGGKEFFA